MFWGVSHLQGFSQWLWHLHVLPVEDMWAF